MRGPRLNNLMNNEQSILDYEVGSLPAKDVNDVTIVQNITYDALVPWLLGRITLR